MKSTHRICFHWIAVTLMSLSIFGCAKKKANPTAIKTITPPTCPSSPKTARAQLPGDDQPRHIPAAVKKLADQGKLAEERKLSIQVGLKLNNQADLEQLLIDLYDVNSPQYRKFLTPDEFRARYAPSADQVAEVTTYLTSHGFGDVTLSASGYKLKAQGRVGAINSAFKTGLHNFSDEDGNSRYAPLVEPTIPANLPIQSILGLHNLTHYQSHIHTLKVDPSPISPNYITALTPANFKTAYNTPTTVDGTGQTLGLVELDGYAASDITTFVNTYGLRAVPLTNVLIDGAVIGGARDPGTTPEATLDIQLMNAMAPGASRIIIYTGPINYGSDLTSIYDRIVTDNLAKQISTSWGAAEDMLSPSEMKFENTYFQQMAAQGQSFYASSGDSGALSDSKTVVVTDPATQPYVTAVGGTSLTVGDSGVYISETSWNAGNGVGGGGGFSQVFSRPSYQQSSLISAATLGCATMRNIPDVSLNAGSKLGYATYFQGKWTSQGGTSASAPLWAAYTALVNQQRLANSLAPIGFANPAIYALGAGSTYDQLFNDIADKSTNLYFPAIKGFDDSTGWGSFKGKALFDRLSNY